MQLQVFLFWNAFPSRTTFSKWQQVETVFILYLCACDQWKVFDLHCTFVLQAEMDKQKHSKVVEQLMGIYGRAVDQEIIYSVAYNCHFNCKYLLFLFLKVLPVNEKIRSEMIAFCFTVSIFTFIWGFPRLFIIVNHVFWW